MTDDVVRAVAAAVRNALDELRGGDPVPGRRPPSDSPLAAGNPVRVTLLRDGRPVGAGAYGRSSLLANARLAVAFAARDAGGDAPDASGGTASPPGGAQAGAGEERPGPTDARSTGDGSAGSDPAGRLAADLVCLVEIALPERRYDGNRVFLPQRLDGGRQGFAVTVDGRRLAVSASAILLDGRGADVLYNRLLHDGGIEPAALLDDAAAVSVYDAALALVPAEGTARRLHRYGRVLPLEVVDRRAVRAALDRAAAWYAAHQRPDGGFPYLYHPTRDETLDAGPNLIRHVFNIAAMGQLQAALGDEALRERGRRALGRILRTHYLEHPRDPWGYLQFNRQVTLGNAAAALSAILRLDALDRHREPAERLARFLEGMRRPGGRYYTHLRPRPRTLGEDYSPGEAQLALMAWRAETGDEDVLKGVRESYRYYRDYWRREGATPFIPWHTQANVRLYRATRERAVADFVFEMNDLLLSIQQNGAEIPADVRGRFFNPAKRATGYPHVGSTGVYLEGLVEAFALARELGDRRRADRYRAAIVRGVRCLLQMQIAPGEETWCMPNPAKAAGGFRTRWDDCAVRIDNQQHCVSALVKVYEEFSEADYARIRADR